jgi:immune inhibitor A
LRFIIIVLATIILAGCVSEAVEFRPPEVAQPLDTASLATKPIQPAASEAVSAEATPSLETIVTVEITHSLTETAVAATSTATKEPTQTASPLPSLTATITPTADRFTKLAEELARVVPPARDDARLAAAFGSMDAAALTTRAAPVSERLVPGTRQTFTVLDVVNNTYGEIEAELFAVGEHAYFWFESGPFGVEPDEDTLAEVVPKFDEIYERVTALFGQENTPGIDGDPRLHVLHASPQTICGVSEDGVGGCGTAGFVSTYDLQPAAVNPRSNEREMFVMNDQQFGSDYYLGVLAHELRHLIEFNYDLTDTDWGKEGSAVLAAELAGLPNNGIERANQFLSDPDQQLNSWTELVKGPYYGQGYLFNQYLYDRLGEDLYREYATSPLPGFLALDSLAAAHGLDYSGESLWLDWLSALAIHDQPQAAEKYRFDLDGLQTASLIPVDAAVGKLAGEVHQYAADYYELPESTSAVEFEGARTVSLFAAMDDNGQIFWYTQRANSSNPRLTRGLDLQAVEKATLEYDVFADIEYGYDFAYVSISTDGGKTWQSLESDNMQGLHPADDPSGSAHTPRFYTGRTQEWRHEVIDLSPFAGQEILLRFEMVTDPVLTYGGLAVDNVAVPEIGYFDAGELSGWSAEGFSLVSSIVAQPWHLQLITFPEQGPVVQSLPVVDGHALVNIDDVDNQRRPILIVAASAPMTLVPAPYELRLSERNGNTIDLEGK